MDGAIAQGQTPNRGQLADRPAVCALERRALPPEKPLPFGADAYAEFVLLVHGNKINSSGAKTLLEAMVQTGKEVSEIVRERRCCSWKIATRSWPWRARWWRKTPKAVADYLGGRGKGLYQFAKAPP